MSLHKNGIFTKKKELNRSEFVYIFSLTQNLFPNLNNKTKMNLQNTIKLKMFAGEKKKIQ